MPCGVPAAGEGVQGEKTDSILNLNIFCLLVYLRLQMGLFRGEDGSNCLESEGYVPLIMPAPTGEPAERDDEFNRS